MRDKNWYQEQITHLWEKRKEANNRHSEKYWNFLIREFEDEFKHLNKGK